MAALTLAEILEIAKTRTLTKAERSRKSKLLNPERTNANARKSFAKHREKRVEALRKRRQENPEKQAEYARTARKNKLARDPDFERRHIAKWREEHPGWNQEYAENNREIIRAQARRRRAKEYGAEGSHTIYELQMLMVRQVNLCANPYCRADLREVEHQLDHKLALARGGSDNITNLQYLCRSCNARKHDLTMSDWLGREERRALRHPPRPLIVCNQETHQ